VPPADFYQPSLLERQPWLKERMGGASVTELEILHGVLRNPEMAGHAMFYLRDPAYAHSQQEAGWVADNPAEQQRLEALKDQIHASGFPVAEEGLATPQAIAERIEADLWAVIEREHPEQEPPDALQREGQRHSDYRRSRTGLYLGGEAAIEQLERWIAEGEQRILITGESGAGKSALIANWLQAHQRSYPQDVVHAHHLGCTNDASAVRPLLGRLIDTASQLLAEDPTAEPVKVPQDWWELVFKVGEVFAMLSALCQKKRCRWILVLDGLDRLAEHDQQALPWIPTTLPPGIHVVTSALDCPARTILQERQYRTHEIGPLGKPEQQQLIERYLSRYTKQLESGLQQKILAHKFAGSPLFLRVLLEELRQCAWFDTLAEQLEFYLAAQTIDGLYAKVLERLESDGHGDATRKALTALWASRAGLSETELLAIRGLLPLEWAPVDLALSEGFGRNGERLVFDHDYLRIAVKDRYLPDEVVRRQAHSEVAHWFADRKLWDARHSEELPWQLLHARQLDDLRDWLLIPEILANLEWDLGSTEVIKSWLSINHLVKGELDELISEAVEQEVEKRKEKVGDQIWFVDRIAALLDKAGLYRELLLRLRAVSLELEGATEARDEERILSSLASLADVHRDMGNYNDAETLYLSCLEARERLHGHEHPTTLQTLNNIGGLYECMGNYRNAYAFYSRALEARERLLGHDHPSTVITVNNLGLLFMAMGDYSRANTFLRRALEAREHLLGQENLLTLTSVNNLATLYASIGDYKSAEDFYNRALLARERLLGPEHPSTLTTVHNLGALYGDMGQYSKAKTLYTRTLEARKRLLGAEHPDTLNSVSSLGSLYISMGEYSSAEALLNYALETRESLLGSEHPSTLTTVHNLGALYKAMGDYSKAEIFYNRVLEAKGRLLEPEHPSILTTVCNLASLYRETGDFNNAESLYNRALEASRRLLGVEHPSTLTTAGNLGALYKAMGDYEKAELILNSTLDIQNRLLGEDHPDTITTLSHLGGLYELLGDYVKAEDFYIQVLNCRERTLGAEHPSALAAMGNLGNLYESMGDYEKSLVLTNRCLKASERVLGLEHPDTLSTLSNLSILHESMGAYNVAESLSLRVLQARERLLGPENPDTLTTINNLGAIYSSMNNHESAEVFYNRCLEAGERRLGPEHPITLTAARNLGILYQTMGDYNKAEVFYIRAVEAEERRFGAEHPTTLTTVDKLAFLYKSIGKYLSAEVLFIRALQAKERRLGAEHKSTLVSVSNLAGLYKVSGDYSKAVACYARCLDAKERRLGSEHKSTQRTAYKLAQVLREGLENPSSPRENTRVIAVTDWAHGQQAARIQ
jgi:tetratricopeptide (TPR) repeat protein